MFAGRLPKIAVCTFLNTNAAGVDGLSFADGKEKDEGDGLMDTGHSGGTAAVPSFICAAQAETQMMMQLSA